MFAVAPETWWVSGAALFGLMVSLWALSVRLEDVSIVDVAWGPAFVVVAIVAAIVGGGGARPWVLLAMTSVWGLRLGVHLGARKLDQPGEDRRYRRLRERHARHFALWSLGGIFVLQGILVWVVSMPVQIAAGRPGQLSGLIAPGLALFILGVLFEAVGDEQLRRFKADRRNQGQVMDRGLWRYTRHPNYFGDACVWWGLWLVVLPAGGTWWTAVGPALMTLLLLRVSGKELLERDLITRRAGYADYVSRTSGFVPLPPRRRRR